jgi:hypothetical protein
MTFCKGTISKDSRRKLTSFNALVSACLLIELYAKVPSKYTVELQVKQFKNNVI